MKETVLAYTAGLIDGEGSITMIRRAGRSRQLRVSMGSTCCNLVTFMKEHHGGYLYTNIDKRSTKPQHQWVITGVPAALFLQNIRPYMHETLKIQRADIVINDLWPLLGKKGPNVARMRRHEEIALLILSVK